VCCGAATSCGARSQLFDGDPPGDGGIGGVSPGGFSAAGGHGGDGAGGAPGGAGGEGGVPLTCMPGEVLACGSDVGECAPGVRNCVDGVFSDVCEGSVEPQDEQCNNLDDDCDGFIDDGFGIGLACDGNDSDQCADDVMTCAGCTLGDDDLESCNGVDDNCNGVIDSDCDIGGCQPSLLVTGSTPSNPNCINFPVMAGSAGTIQYPCSGGAVAATLGAISFTGNVTNGNVLLTGTQQMIGPDNCLWKMDHAIQGSLPSGTLTYTYQETLLSPPPGCWSPCSEIGTVAVTW
jgi:hypothetical protein